MHTRVVLIKLKEHWSQHGKAQEFAEASEKKLNTVPGVVSCTGTLPSDNETKGAWDVCLFLTFEKPDDVESYKIHPIHQSYLKDDLIPKMEAKKVWNFHSV